MRTVTSLCFSVLLLLFGACGQVKPDTVQSIESIGGSHSVELSIFQPRGTIEGYIALVFRGSVAEKHRTAWISQLENAKLGWTTTGQFVIVADQLAYSGLSSKYFPTGAADSRVDVIACIRTVVDCSRLEATISERVLEFRKFPRP
jgi:hypothetical protein